MKSECPKPFLPLCGKPILLHAIESFYRYSNTITVVLVLAETDLSWWKSLCNQYPTNKHIPIQKGGVTRFQSVKNGLAKIEGEGLVAIHDGVRPLVSPKVIKTSFDLAASHQSAVATVSLRESICRIHNSGTKTLDRSQYRITQTPQTFSISLIKEAYKTVGDMHITDDASVAEQAGHKVHIFEGEYENIKITTQKDLVIAEALLSAQRKGC